MFAFWDWVGGRYSMCSAIGLSTMLAIARTNFRALLDGFHQMDEHFRTAPFEQKPPGPHGAAGHLVHGLLRSADAGRAALRAIPEALPGLLQQMTMESNGKSVTLDGRAVDYDTGAVYWASRAPRPAFLLPVDHQGTRLIPCDFIAFGQTLTPLGRHHDMLIANVFAQSEALAFGLTVEQVKAEGVPDWLVPHRIFEGNRPSNTILAERLTPAVLGALVALYEHCVFHARRHLERRLVRPVGACNWAKVLAQRIVPELEAKDAPALTHDSSTNSLIRRYRNMKEA